MAHHRGAPAGRSDDAVRNRWKRLSADRAGQANAVADALGLTATPEGGDALPMPGGTAAAATPAAPKAPPKPKPERLAWSKAEDDMIIRSVQEYGLKWGKISAHLPGRTAHAIRNRFHRLQELQKQQAAAANATLPMPHL